MRARYLIFLVLLFIIYFPLAAQAACNQEVAPPTNLKAVDTPNDAGKSITLSWQRSADDGTGRNNVVGYQIFRSTQPDTGFSLIQSVSSGTETYIDNSVNDGVDYYYIVRVTDGTNLSNPIKVGPVRSKGQWFHTGRINVLVMYIVCAILILVFIMQGKRGKEIPIRPIAGLEAIDEAIGRATEMGKPVLYSPGISNIDRISTIASMNILGSVATKVAEYGTPLIVPCRFPIVMTVAQEVVKESYLRAGHPEAYNEGNILYVTESQFGYAAGVDGIIVREKPAANLFLGTYGAESLILAETGSTVGAIQIAGTDSSIQLAFFIVACDYTLIGEELYAASAYLTKDPEILGSLKGQDWLKIIITLLIILGGMFSTLRLDFFIKLFKIG
ncbi:MAG TPA: fibronectin type III domain-containing protein [bacterium (Candidatus Stahlbacteria)]|nr:fibronectin type III domain-containing protein [Candidatus Stahlbacteria bacterium]